MNNKKLKCKQKKYGFVSVTYGNSGRLSFVGKKVVDCSFVLVYPVKLKNK